MAKTEYATGDAEVQKLWDEDLVREINKESYFSRFESLDGSSIVHKKVDLNKKKGDSITFTIRYRGNRSFLPEGTSVEGNEGRLDTATESVLVTPKRFGIRDNGAIDRQRPTYDMDAETRRAIVEDGAECVDNEYFTELRSTNTFIFHLTAGVFTTTATLATATAAVTAVDMLSPELITKMKTVALTDRANGRIPLRPIKIDGKMYLVLLCHSYALADLKVDSTYAQAQREAEIRGEKNPIFTGAVGVWDGVIIHEHENIYKAQNAGGIYYAQNYLMGAQALVSAFAMEPKIVAEEFDYGNEHGYAFNSIWGLEKPQFTKPGGSTAEDYGSRCVVTAVTNLV